MYYRVRRIMMRREDVQVYIIFTHVYVQGQADNDDEGGCTSVYYYVQMFMYRARLKMMTREDVQVYLLVF